MHSVGRESATRFIKAVERRQAGCETIVMDLLLYLYHCMWCVLQLLQKDSPELFDLLEDFEDRLSEVVDTLHPLVTVARDTPTITPKVRYQ